VKPILVLDTETTGLLLHPDVSLDLQPRMVEFGGIYLDSEDGRIISEFQQKINPEIHIPEETTRVHGLTDEDVANCPTFYRYAARLYDIILGARVIVAHNLPFDKTIIMMECERNGYPEIPIAWRDCKEVCTIDVYREQFGKEMRLTALYEAVCGHKLAQEHRGLADVRALVDIIQKDRLWEIF